MGFFYACPFHLLAYAYYYSRYFVISAYQNKTVLVTPDLLLLPVKVVDFVNVLLQQDQHIIIIIST